MRIEIEALVRERDPYRRIAYGLPCPAVTDPTPAGMTVATGAE